MQNKPNFLDSPMNIIFFLTNCYKQKPPLRSGPKQTQNKPKTNPKQTQSNPISKPAGAVYKKTKIKTVNFLGFFPVNSCPDNSYENPK